MDLSNNIVESLKKKSQEPKRRKITKTTFLVNIYKGLPGREGDQPPSGPVTGVEELSTLLEEAEKKGYFKIRRDIKCKRDRDKYLRETKWYLKMASKNNMIELK